LPDGIKGLNQDGKTEVKPPVGRTTGRFWSVDKAKRNKKGYSARQKGTTSGLGGDFKKAEKLVGELAA